MNSDDCDSGDSDNNPESVNRLVARAADGSQMAAGSLYKRFVMRLLTFAKRKIGNDVSGRVGADDIVQSTFRTFFRRATDGAYEFENEAGLWSLLRTIAHNKVRKQASHHRAQKRDVSKTASFEPAFQGATAGGDEHHELRILVEELMQEMTEREQSIVQMRIEGFKVAEIAEKTNCSKRTTERVLNQFRELLARNLDMST